MSGQNDAGRRISWREARQTKVGPDAVVYAHENVALMARPRRGTLRRQPTERGISYGVAFSYRGQQVYVHLGGEWEGWDDERAAEEQHFLMEKVNRGEWSPPPTDSALGAANGPPPTFQVEASEWLYRRRLRTGDTEGQSKTIRDLEWRLSVVMDKLGPVPIDRIDFALADELVIELCEERAAIERAAAAGEPLKRTVRTASGRSYEARRRSVSNGSMRRALDTAERVLRDAKRRGMLTGDVPSLKSAAPKADRPVAPSWRRSRSLRSGALRTPSKANTAASHGNELISSLARTAPQCRSRASLAFRTR